MTNLHNVKKYIFHLNSEKKDNNWHNNFSKTVALEKIALFDQNIKFSRC